MDAANGALRRDGEEETHTEPSGDGLRGEVNPILDNRESPESGKKLPPKTTVQNPAAASPQPFLPCCVQGLISFLPVLNPFPPQSQRGWAESGGTSPTWHIATLVGFCNCFPRNLRSPGNGGST